MRLVEGVTRRFGTAGAADCLGGSGFTGWAYFCGSAFGRLQRCMAVWDQVLRHGVPIFDGRVGRHESVMGVGSVLPRGIGEHGSGVGSANLGRLEKISLVCFCSAGAWRGALVCRS